MKLGSLKTAGLLIVLLAGATPGRAQRVENPLASVVDVASCQAKLRSTTDPLLLDAKKDAPSCVGLPFVPAPVGRMIIPRHYLSGSSGPVNPAEAAATRAYEAFERRIAAGVAQYLATGSHAESASALDQLDAWAKAGALLDYSRVESQQAWFQVEWTLSASGIADSVLLNDATLDPAEQQRVTSWLAAACREVIGFEKPGDTRNNHYYWRALAAVSIGVTASDDALFRHGIEAYKQAIGEVDANGALPKEMARHENAIHYQGFALQPLVTYRPVRNAPGLRPLRLHSPRPYSAGRHHFFRPGRGRSEPGQALHRRRSIHPFQLRRFRAVRLLQVALRNGRAAFLHRRCTAPSRCIIEHRVHDPHVCAVGGKPGSGPFREKRTEPKKRRDESGLRNAVLGLQRTPKTTL